MTHATHRFAVSATLVALSGCLMACSGAVQGVDDGGDGGDGGDASSALELAIEVTDQPVRISSIHSLVFDGDNFVILWTQIPEGARDTKLMIARVSPQGAVADEPRELMSFADPPNSARAFALSDRYVLWYRHTGNPTAVHALSVDRSSLTASPARKFDEISRSSSQSRFSVAHHADRFALLVQKTDQVTVEDEQRNVDRLHLRFFGDDLVSLGLSKPLNDATVDQRDPSLIWFDGNPDNEDGAGFVGLWTEESRVYRALIDPSGAITVQPNLIFDTAEDQGSPRALDDGQGKLLFSWYESHVLSPLYLLGDAQSNVWTAPRRLLPDNRAESLTLSQAIHHGNVLIAWETDVAQPLTQIHVGWLDLGAGGTSVESVRPITDPAFPYWVPSAAASPSVVAVLFQGEVRGSARLYLRLLPYPQP